MKTRIKSIAVVIGVLVVALAILPVFSFAQNPTPPGVSGQGEVPGEGSHQGWEKGKHKGWTKDELLKLKKENPEEFKKLVQQRREEICKYLEYLKQTNPQRYRKIMQRIRQQRLARLKKLRQENPEKFKELMEKRRAACKEYLEKLKTEDPQKYQKIMDRINKMKELRRLKQENPEKFKEYLKNHPPLRQHWENRRKGIKGNRKDAKDTGIPSSI